MVCTRMTPEDRLTALITLRLPPALKAELEAMAHAEERSMSWITLRALREDVARRREPITKTDGK